MSRGKGAKSKEKGLKSELFMVILLNENFFHLNKFTRKKKIEITNEQKGEEDIKVF